jgi:hypothetical protein
LEENAKSGPRRLKGNYVQGEGKQREIYYPDLTPYGDAAPHWDYIGPDCPMGKRLYLDGSSENKE